MKSTGIVILATCFFTAVPFVAQARQANYTVDADKVCIRGYGNTITEAFESGLKLAEHTDTKIDGKKCLDSNVRIHILPKKKNGLFVVEVYSSPNKGICNSQTNNKIARVALP